MFRKLIKYKPARRPITEKELKIKVTVDCDGSIEKLNDLADAMDRVRESAAKLREYGIKI